MNRFQQFAHASRTMRTIAAAGLIALASGCAVAPERIDPVTLRSKALSFLKFAAGYRDNPVIRTQAIEALHEVAPDDGVPWFREALVDTHEGVRFAACMVLGDLRHEASRKLLTKAVDSENRSVRAAALFALHRLGDVSRTSQLAELLLHDPSATVRANAALVIGQLGEPGTSKLLDRAAQYDRSPLVRMQALEGMVRMGDKNAADQLTMHAHGGAGQWQVTALLAMARSPLENRVRLLQYRLEHGDHLETRLAAARGLGWNGNTEGYNAAIKALRFDRPVLDINVPEDDSDNQVTRIRSMAAFALGAIGDERALPALRVAMASSNDMRIRLAAARAVVEILNRSAPATLAAAKGNEGS